MILYLADLIFNEDDMNWLHLRYEELYEYVSVMANPLLLRPKFLSIG